MGWGGGEVGWGGMYHTFGGGPWPADDSDADRIARHPLANTCTDSANKTNTSVNYSPCFWCDSQFQARQQHTLHLFEPMVLKILAAS